MPDPVAPCSATKKRGQSMTRNHWVQGSPLLTPGPLAYMMAQMYN